MRIAVTANGRVSACSVTQSSGSALLDATTCRLAQRRFRYEPARDAQGKAVPDVVEDGQRWWIEAP
jgi:protein TonB